MSSTDRLTPQAGTPIGAVRAPSPGGSVRAAGDAGPSPLRGEA